MANKVAVEPSLSNVKQLLQQNGYEVIDLDGAQNNASGVQCCVISGMDQNIMGMQDIQMDVPVINMSGMSAEEALQEVQQRCNNMAQS